MSASRVKRDAYKINKGAVAVQAEAGPDAPQFEFPAQLKPVNNKLISSGSYPPVTHGVPLYCLQQGNDHSLYKAPIEDLRMRLTGASLYDGNKMSLSDLVGYKEVDLIGQKAYPFQRGLKTDDGGRPLFPSAL